MNVSKIKFKNNNHYDLDSKLGFKILTLLKNDPCIRSRPFSGHVGVVNPALLSKLRFLVFQKSIPYSKNNPNHHIDSQIIAQSRLFSVP